MRARWLKLPLFWRFQLPAWAAFVAVTFPLKWILTGSLTGALILSLTRDGSSFLLTLLLRYIYRTFWSRDLERMSIVIILACTLAGLLQVALLFPVHSAVSNLGEVAFSHAMKLDALYERTGLLYAWSFLYFGFRHAIEGVRRHLQLALLEIRMLRAQMNSHFLYNALNTLQAEAGKSPEHLIRLIQALADYLRYSLENRSKDFIPFGREIDAITNYLTVEEARYRGDLDIEYHIDDSARSLLVPGVVLQPLVENAIKYGRKTAPKPFTVRLVITRLETGSVRIQVANMGRWVEQTHRRPEGGVGLENLRKRLALLYPHQPKLFILKEENWVSVQLDLPNTHEAA